eukprot:c1885_g1_i1.p1 GENE.c1885_g1_i1~~c1885_g1_i1.p1  ORF type:complete len:425 (-),score=98.08 c1885_g1_i1:324-1598(-)
MGMTHHNHMQQAPTSPSAPVLGALSSAASASNSTEQPKLNSPQNTADMVDLDANVEKIIVQNVLLRLFNQQMTKSLMKTFYPNNGSTNTLQFYSSKPNLAPSSPRTEQGTLDQAQTNTSDELIVPGLCLSDHEENSPSSPNQLDTGRAWCRFQVDGFTLSHFAKDVFPPFIVSLVQLNGESLPRIVEDGVTKPMADMRVRMTFRNKWTEVSSEVLPDTEFVRTLRDGKVEISDLVFQDVTLKHGGYFVMHIMAVDYGEEVLEWKSEKFVIQSVKTHCNKKRKLTGGSRNRKSTKNISPEDDSHNSNTNNLVHKSRVQAVADSSITTKQSFAQQTLFSNQSRISSFQVSPNMHVPNTTAVIGLPQQGPAGPRTNSNFFSSGASHHTPHQAPHTPASTVAPASLPRLQSNIVGSMCRASRDPYNHM